MLCKTPWYYHVILFKLVKISHDFELGSLCDLILFPVLKGRGTMCYFCLILYNFFAKVRSLQMYTFSDKHFAKNKMVILFFSPKKTTTIYLRIYKRNPHFWQFSFKIGYKNWNSKYRFLIDFKHSFRCVCVCVCVCADF